MHLNQPPSSCHKDPLQRPFARHALPRLYLSVCLCVCVCVWFVMFMCEDHRHRHTDTHIHTHTHTHTDTHTPQLPSLQFLSLQRPLLSFSGRVCGSSSWRKMEKISSMDFLNAILSAEFCSLAGCSCTFCWLFEQIFTLLFIFFMSPYERTECECVPCCVRHEY